MCQGLGVKQSRCSFYFDGIFSLTCYFIYSHLLCASLQALINNAGNKNLTVTLVNVQQSQLLGWILEMSILLIYWLQSDPVGLLRTKELFYYIEYFIFFFSLIFFQNQPFLLAGMSSIQSSLYPSIHASLHLSIHLSIYPSIYSFIFSSYFHQKQLSFVKCSFSKCCPRIQMCIVIFNSNDNPTLWQVP